MVRPDDPVVNRKGECIGFVTSCILIDKAQIGLAIVDHAYATEGTELGIFILPHKDRDAAEKAKSQLQIGDKVSVHEEAVVLPRFHFFS
jgi:glycine cleavage system aminomethyltransferase T